METHLPTHNLIREVMLQRIWLGDVQTEKVPTVARGAEVLRVDHAVDRVQIGSILELDGTLDIMPQLKIPGIEGKADILHLIRVQVSDGNVNVEIRGRLSPRGDGYFEGLSVTIEAYVSHGDAINPCRPAFFRNNLTLAVLTKVIPSCRVIERIAIGIGKVAPKPFLIARDRRENADSWSKQVRGVSAIVAGRRAFVFHGR